MTTRILKRFDISSMEYLETLIDAGFKTVQEVKEREIKMANIKKVEFQKIASLILNIGSGTSDK